MRIGNAQATGKNPQPAGSGHSKGEALGSPILSYQVSHGRGSGQCKIGVQQGVGIHLSIQPTVEKNKKKKKKNMRSFPKWKRAIEKQVRPKPC